MSALVHMPNPTRVGRELGLRLLGPFLWFHLPTKFGVQVQKDPYLEGDETERVEAELLSGKEVGTRVSVLGPNQRAILRLGVMTPGRYHAHVTVNPDLFRVATVQAWGIVEPKRSVPLDLVIHTSKELNLMEVEWFCRLHCFE